MKNLEELLGCPCCQETDGRTGAYYADTPEGYPDILIFADEPNKAKRQARSILAELMLRNDADALDIVNGITELEALEIEHTGTCSYLVSGAKLSPDGEVAVYGCTEAKV